MQLRIVAFAALFLPAPLAPAFAQASQPRLWEASVSGDTTAVRLALAGGARVDSLDTGRSRNGRRALNYAALNNRVEVIQLLLASGAQINAANLTGFTALHHAAEAGSLEAARALLDAGANPTLANANGLTPSQVARAQGNAQVADILEAAERNPPVRRP